MTTKKVQGTQYQTVQEGCFYVCKTNSCAIYNFGTNRGDTICLMSSKVRNSPTMRLFFTAHDRSEISSDIDDITYVYIQKLSLSAP